jgi:small subunit ribosomal protein S16
VAVKIKLMRMGKIRAPYYRIVVADSRTKRDGRGIETIGRYHPASDPSLIEVNSERAQYWLGVGAQPTEPVAAILKVTGDWQTFRGEPGGEGTLRHPEQKKDKKATFEAAAKEAAAEPKDGATTAKKRTARKAAEKPADKPAAEKPADKPADAADTPADETPAGTEASAPSDEAADQPADASVDQPADGDKA